MLRENGLRGRIERTGARILALCQKSRSGGAKGDRVENERQSCGRAVAPEGIRARSCPGETHARRSTRRSRDPGGGHRGAANPSRLPRSKLSVTIPIEAGNRTPAIDSNSTSASVSEMQPRKREAKESSEIEFNSAVAIGIGVRAIVENLTCAVTSGTKRRETTVARPGSLLADHRPISSRSSCSTS